VVALSIIVQNAGRVGPMGSLPAHLLGTGFAVP
jgi:hypothetical protein